MAERGRPLFSIGAAARMVGVAPATIRTWETRYGFVVPKRSTGGQRLYSRDQVEQLRFVRSEVTAGRRPAEAHRLLAERIARGDSLGGPKLRLLLAENRIGTAELLRRLFGSDVFELLPTSDAEVARQAVEELSPAVVVVDRADIDFEELADRLRDSGIKVLPLDLSERPLSLVDGERAQSA